MGKADASETDDMRAEYDFSSGKKNPFADRFAVGSNIVMMRPEIFASFPSEKAVNEALESLMRAGMTAAAGKSLTKQEKVVLNRRLS